MRLSVKAGRLKNAVKAVWPSVAAHVHNEIRVYDPILIKADDGKVCLFSSSVSRFSQSSAEAKVDEAGEIAVPGGILRDIARTEEETTDLVIYTSENDNGFKELVITCDKKTTYRLHTFEPDRVTVNEIGEDYTFKFKLPIFRAMLEETAPASGRAEAGEGARYQFGAIEIKRQVYEDENLDVIRTASTDGHRIHLVEADVTEEISLAHGDFDVLDGRGILIDRSITQILSTFDDEEEFVELSFPMGKAYLVLRAGGVAHGVRVIAGDFPPYEKIIDGVDVESIIKIKRTAFNRAIKAGVALGQNTMIHLVSKPGADDPFTVLAIRKAEGGKNERSSSALTADFIEGGDVEFDVLMNPRYLIDSLKAIPDTDEVELLYSGDRSPVVVRHPDRYFRSFVMPMVEGQVPT